MTDYGLKELEQWNQRIEELARPAGLDFYEQQFEICSYEDMLCYEAYVGMPSRYPHWSFGKTYDRQKTFYQYNLTGLPYEMVINANPCLAYLMRDNTLLLQILTMAHVYGHNDFFKNNRLFRQGTRAELTVETFKAHADRVRSYIQDPSLGEAKVERILDAAHALRFQVRLQGDCGPNDRAGWDKEEKESVPTRLKNDLLGFLALRGRLENWERDLVGMVREESYYFLPQMETKIMNEGWASYWHYQILNRLELPQDLHLEFLQRHNLVVRPHEGSINPYFLGFKMFERLAREGKEKMLEIRAEERDCSFIRRYLDQQMCQELNLFAYKKRGNELVVSEKADEEGWKVIRDQIANSCGLGSIPVISISGVEGGDLVLEHDFDGRELDMGYANETIKYVNKLWGGQVNLKTKLNGKERVLRCDKDGAVSVLEG